MSIIGAPANLLDGLPQTMADARQSNLSREEISAYLESFIQSVSGDAEKLVESFKTASAKSIFVMAECWKASPVELVPAHVLLKTFLYHVNGAYVPRARLPPIENDPSERAWASFIGLQEKFVKEFPTNPDFRTRIIAAWPGIFKWCRYFYTQRVSAVPDFDTARTNSTVLCTVIRHFLADSQLFKVIHETNGIVKLCTQLWMHRAAPAPLTSFIMHTLLVESTAEELDAVVATSGDKPDIVAQLAISRLRTAMNESPMQPTHVYTYTYTLLVLSRLPRHRLTEAVLAGKGAWVAARMLTITADALRRRARPEPDIKYHQCLNAGFNFLRFGLVRDDSPRWVAQAVEAGMLRVICELAPLLEKVLPGGTMAYVQHILADTLPKHMVYLSVVKLVDREMNDLDEEVAEAGVQRSCLRDEWNSLKKLTSLRSGIAKLPKKVKGAAGTVCESTACTKTGTRRELLRCTGCMYVYYCSKKCQKDAWPNHRAICKLKNKQRTSGEEGPLPFSKSNAQFFRELFSTDANLHMGHLHKLAARAFPAETQGEHFAICLDYTNTTYPSGTCSLKDIRTYTFPPLSGDELNPEDVVAQNNAMITMVRNNPKAYTFIEASFAFGEQRLSRNFMIRPNMWAHPAQPELNWDGKKMCENGEAEANAAEFLETVLGLDFARALGIDLDADGDDNVD
ncbi:hypothetical protein B0H15DRAFT_885651 [Mycena belliarum]|uniref:MYND-type domain-containing protein n=1 Tax=Mycena belliarum TaxID=1033014 RepID=A0AAD6XUP5_9AGAR|nr:hypothetical protein B0H15DRAFT_885651 [Mycena belliae]